MTIYPELLLAFKLEYSSQLGTYFNNNRRSHNPGILEGGGRFDTCQDLLVDLTLFTESHQK